MGPWLSAVTQGNSISVLTRAYQLTGQEIFIDITRHAIRTFEKDILDGGICTPVGTNGVFFEEFGIYPASHTLTGLIFGLYGLYDYVMLSHDSQIERLIQNSLAAMHILLVEFEEDFGYVKIYFIDNSHHLTTLPYKQICLKDLPLTQAVNIVRN